MNFNQPAYTTHIFMGPDYLKYDSPLVDVFRTNHTLIKRGNSTLFVKFVYQSYYLGII